ncbi:hypothetical protein NG895_21660 [Aeoliella sp. ICT_H6.2]|uniref:DUF1570 domain-containing protein n=1 Tax=Aeoliella straminimaris TaxID=2954799 RepID=A0A9X2FCP1_9BACT|nr:hypothetical protein [Aeoliella straminimaris]MCO6046515.1 hypothetical protein [Aeoliella straminimaris]
MNRFFATTCLLLAAAIPPLAIGQGVEEIRAEWQKLRSYPTLECGQYVLLAPDDYSYTESTRPADPELAAKLSELAHRAADLGEAALAIRLATEAVVADPDCEPARLALGYEKHDGRWLTSYGARMAGRGLEWNSSYGWIDPEDLPRYEAGERPYRRRWVSKEIDAEKHSNIAQGWQIRTDHFNVTTNHSLEAGVALAGKLEQLHQVWLSLFADFAIDDGELRNRFEKHRVPGVRSRPYQVVYHRTQDEYNQELVARQPRIAETIGIYFDFQREAHFFFSEEYATDPTLYHESVHQLFQESDGARRDPGLKDNFWAVEGVATMFESLRQRRSDDGVVYFTIGTPEAGRLASARRRLLEEGYRVPLGDLVTLGKRDLQGRSDLVPLYSQMAGLATFCMQSPDHRPHFVEYLQQIYAHRAEPATLSTLMGRTYADLDGQYREFLLQLAE